MPIVRFVVPLTVVSRLSSSREKGDCEEGNISNAIEGERNAIEPRAFLENPLSAKRRQFSRLLCGRLGSVRRFHRSTRGVREFLTGGHRLNRKFARLNGLQMFSCPRAQWEVDSNRFLDSTCIGIFPLTLLHSGMDIEKLSP